MISIVRTEEDADVPAIFAVHRACFPSDDEARLVDALRAAGRLVVSLVAVVNEEIVGHVAFSPVTAEDGATGLGLAPLAVVKEHRQKGIGAHLVRTGLLACKTADYGWAVVLGDPDYYGRFGFEPASKFGLSDEFRGGPHFQALELIAGQMPTGAGLVRYAPGFNAFA
jgi:putative acetyltransferase